MTVIDGKATSAELKRRADEGDIEAQKSLALLNELGFDPEHNNQADAFRLWLAVAKKGDPWAQLSVAKCYLEGLGTDVDSVEARHWLERAKAQGFNSAKVWEKVLREPARIKVLAVDDSDVILRTIKADLEPTYAVITALSAKEAFKMIADHQGIRVIISDVNMPEIDGITMVEKLAAIGLTKRIPIIMLTTESAKELVVRGTKAGLAGWMIKPPKRELLLRAMEKLANDFATQTVA